MLLPLLAVLTACEPDPVALTGEGLLAAGCPVPGEASARWLTLPEERPEGADALAEPGDVLLLNTRAAFVIGAPGNRRTWYPYGGLPLDAVALRGCTQASPERLGELGFVLGELELEDYVQSTLRLFRGEEVEVVSDGSSGGPAVVEVHGVDDHFWLVEQELIKAAFEAGRPKSLSEPFGLDFTLRYTLAPEDAVLQIDLVLEGEPGEGGYLVGAFTIPSDRTPTLYYHDDAISIGGFGFDVGVPWLAASAGEGATAIAVPGGRAALARIAGTTTLIDADQALEPIKPGLEGFATVEFLLAVGAGHTASASCALEPHLPEPVPGLPFDGTAISGQVVDAEGAAAADTTVEVLLEDAGGTWRVLDRLAAGADGRFAGRVAGLGKGSWRVRAAGPGRDTGATQEVDALEGLRLVAEPPGRLVLDTRDDTGAAVPARVELDRVGGGSTIVHHVPGDGGHALVPGSYDAWLSRGYEHSLAQGSVEVPEDGEGTLSATLSPVLDSTGWISIDAHVHSEPSPDSQVLPVDRMRSAAAAGLDVVITTDHDGIVDLSGAVVEAGVERWVRTQLGSEVTATLPEHMNAWPFPPVPEQARGDLVEWYGHSQPEIYARIRDRGAEVIQLNHARVNGECGLLCLLDWDRVSESPSLEDPTELGLPSDGPVWSWDLDAFEVMNSNRSPFLDPADPRHTGAFSDWLAFHNLGHRVTGMAVTDVHGLDIPGMPLTWLAVDDDDPATVTDEALVDAVLGGHAVMSTGALARVSIDGAGPGDTVTDTDGEVVLELRVEALPEVDVTEVHVLVNCDAASQVDTTDPGEVVKHDGEVSLSVSEDAHVVVVGFGTASMPRGLKGYNPATVPRFITNPIFVDADGDGDWTAPGPKGCTWEN